MAYINRKKPPPRTDYLELVRPRRCYSEKFLQSFPDWPVAEAVDRGWAELFQGLFVEARAVTLVARKTVLRILFVVLPHYRIPRDFRDDRSRGNRDTLRITLYDTLDRALSDKLHSSIYDYIIRRDTEVLYGHLHGLEGRLIDINPVDHLFVDNTYADDRLLEYLFVGALAFLRGKLLRIVYLAREVEALTYDRARDDRSCEGPSPRLIDAGYQRISGTI